MKLYSIHVLQCCIYMVQSAFFTHEGIMDNNFLTYIRRSPFGYQRLVNHRERFPFIFRTDPVIIYWVYENKKIIKSTLFNSYEPLAHVQGDVYGLAEDWVHNNLYWTHEKKMLMMSIDTKQKALLYLAPDGYILRAMVTDPRDEYRYLFWSEYSIIHPPRMMRSSLDGTNVAVLLEQINRVDTIILDPALIRIFWYDYTEKRLRHMAYQGGNATTLYSYDHTSTLEAFSISPGEHIIFKEQANQVKININECLENCNTHVYFPFVNIWTIVFRNFYSLYGTTTPEANNVCQNTQCSGICLPEGNSTRCIAEHPAINTSSTTEPSTMSHKTTKFTDFFHRILSTTRSPTESPTPQAQKAERSNDIVSSITPLATTVSGGIQITIKGSDLASYSSISLNVTLYTSTKKETVNKLIPCHMKDFYTVRCKTPNFFKEIASNICQFGEQEDDEQNVQCLQGSIMYFGVILKDEQDNSIPVNSFKTPIIYKDPFVNDFEAGYMTLLTYHKDKVTLEIKGSNMDVGELNDQYKILVDHKKCFDIIIDVNTIKCTVPEGLSKTATVEVTLGNLHFKPGYIKLDGRFWSCGDCRVGLITGLCVFVTLLVIFGTVLKKKKGRWCACPKTGPTVNNFAEDINIMSTDDEGLTVNNFAEDINIISTNEAENIFM